MGQQSVRHFVIPKLQLVLLILIKYIFTFLDCCYDKPLVFLFENPGQVWDQVIFHHILLEFLEFWCE